jgi:hypothetical protein
LRVSPTRSSSELKVLSHYIRHGWNPFTEIELSPKLPVVWGDSFSLGVFVDRLEEVFIEIELVEPNGDIQKVRCAATPMLGSWAPEDLYGPYTRSSPSIPRE